MGRRYLLPSLVGAAAIAAAALYFSWSTTRHQALAEAELLDLGAERTALLRDLRREPDPDRVRMRLARAILARELELGMSGLEAVDDAALARAREHAQAVLGARPASWQAAMVLGGARYLELSRGRRPIAERDREGWVRPLELAARLGRGQAEPERVLAAIYLSEWSRLDGEGRRRATATLAAAMRDRSSLDLLLAPWLRVAPGHRAALDLLPDTAYAWGRVREFYRASQDWERYLDARSRERSALHREFEAKLAEAEVRLAGKDPHGARLLVLEVLDRVEPGSADAAILARALRTLPPGPVRAYQVEALRRWIDWGVESWLAGRHPFDDFTVERLTSSAEIEQPALLATLALLRDDRAAARMHERQALSTLGPEWAPYWIALARTALREGSADMAAKALSRVHHSWHGSGAYRSLLAGGAAPPPPATDGGGWHLGPDGARLDLAGRAHCGAYRLRFEQAPAAGAPAALRWNGTEVAAIAAYPGLEIEIPAPPGGGSWRLEVIDLEAAGLVPGPLRGESCEAHST